MPAIERFRLVRHWRWIARDGVVAARFRANALLHRGDPLAHRGGHAAPVVMLPGVYETWHFLEPLADRLAALGHPVHLLAHLRTNRRPIPETAGVVARYLEEEGLERVVLVAHSKGGLIGKYLMAFDDTAGRVDRLVALASPFTGSAYARYMLQPALRTFRPMDPTVRMLGDRDDVNPRITSIYPEFDPQVPQGSAIPGATNIEVPVRGHFRVLIEPVAVEAVIDAVEGRRVRSA